MELSTSTTTTTPATDTNVSNQMSTSTSISTLSNNNNNNSNSINTTSSTSTTNARPIPNNGNDNLQCHMQKQQNPDKSITQNQLDDSNAIIQQNISNIKGETKLMHEIISNTNGKVVLPAEQEQSCYSSMDGNQISVKILSNSSVSFDAEMDPEYNVPVSNDSDDIMQVIETVLERVEADMMRTTVHASSQSSSLYVNESSVTSFVTPMLDDEDVDDDKPKDIVTLKNLELTPPPQPLEEIAPSEPSTTKRRNNKRSHSESANEDSNKEGRSKRQRKQTELFQVESKDTRKSMSKTPATNPTNTTPNPKALSLARKSKASSVKRAPSRVRSATPRESPQPLQVPQMSQPLSADVIFYEKNDFLAIRNEDNYFYLCQLVENVRSLKDFIRIKWLDTKDDGKTYFLTSDYDKVPQKSIIMPVAPKVTKGSKRKHDVYILDDNEKESILDRLKKSLNSLSAQ